MRGIRFINTVALILTALALAGICSAENVRNTAYIGDSMCTGTEGGVPVYSLMPNTEYQFGTMGGAVGKAASYAADDWDAFESEKESYISQVISETEEYLESSGIDGHIDTLEYELVGCGYYFTFGSDESSDISDFSVTTTYEDDLVVRSVSYAIYTKSKFSGTNVINVGAPELEFQLSHKIAYLRVMPPDYFAQIQISWNYPGQDRDLYAQSERYTQLRQALSCMYPNGFQLNTNFSENQMALYGLEPFDIHARDRRAQDTVYLFYGGRGDANGLWFTDGYNEEYITFETMGKRLAKVKCNVILVLDIVAEEKITDADQLAFYASLEKLAASAPHATVLGYMDDSYLSETAHLHWSVAKESEYFDRSEEVVDRNFLVGALCGATDLLAYGSDPYFSPRTLYNESNDVLETLTAQFSDMTWVYYIVNNNGPIDAPSFEGKPVTSPLTEPAPKGFLVLPDLDIIEDGYYMVGMEDSPVALDDIARVQVSSDETVCKCYGVEILPVVDAVAGKAHIEIENGVPMLYADQPGLIQLKFYSIADPTQNLSIYGCIYITPERVLVTPKVAILTPQSPSSVIFSRCFPLESWQKVEFESSNEELVQVMQVGIDSAVVSTSSEEEGVAVVRAKSTVNELVCDYCYVIVSKGLQPARAYAYAYADDGRTVIEHLTDSKEPNQWIGNPNITYSWLPPVNVMNNAEGNAGQRIVVLDSSSCSALTSLVTAGIDPDVAEIRDYAFEGCVSLRQVYIPATVGVIKEDAFPSGITIAGESGSAAEMYARRVGAEFTNVIVTTEDRIEVKKGQQVTIDLTVSPAWVADLGTEYSVSDDRILKIESDGSIIANGEGSAVITVTIARGYTKEIDVTVTASAGAVFPASVYSIQDGAFEGSAIETAVIDENCVSIGANSFADCRNLTSVSIPSSVRSIADGAFDGSPNVFIICEPDSPAAAYADRNGIPHGESPKSAEE